MRRSSQPPQRAERTLKEGVTAVLVDVVVRDRRGQPVRDLTQSDFEVLEDGVAQTIGSFTRVFDWRGPAGRQRPVPTARPARRRAPHLRRQAALRQRAPGPR